MGKSLNSIEIRLMRKTSAIACLLSTLVFYISAEASDFNRGSLVNKNNISVRVDATKKTTSRTTKRQSKKQVKKQTRQNQHFKKSASATKGAPSSRNSIGASVQRSALPSSKALQAPAAKVRSMGAVKPPRSNSFYDSGTKEAEYEKLLDREIRALFAASKKSARSNQRGEIWLRLAERYVEKARLVEFREQSNFDKRVKAFAEGKTKIKPRLNLAATREYNKKAVQLYEWFVRDFPRDPKIDQALFFLGYNYFELGNTKKGEDYYQQLVSHYPNSVYVTESNFALGEFYFENDDWKKAYGNYQKVIKARRARLASFAYYKAAWCLYRLGHTGNALKYLDRVVKMSRLGDSSSNIAGRRSVNRIRLGIEALKDYVPFYADLGKFEGAYSQFLRVSGDEKAATQMLEKLAYLVADQGNRTVAAKLFHQLIGFNVTGERAAEYQYQIVLAYTTQDPKEFRKQVEIWLENFGPSSLWVQENNKNKKLTADVAKLQETTVRNYVLQLHQTAQNSRATYSQQLADSAYNLYVRHFSDSPQIAEMQFFHAELLFDMGRFNDAARLYLFASEKDVKGTYKEKALLNAVLAYEKALPSDEEVAEKRGKSLDPIPLDLVVDQFAKAAKSYTATYPRGDKVSDIERRLGVLYYSYNHFDEAIPIFEHTLYTYPGTANAEIAGNLILDIYKLKNDMVGFAEKGAKFMANPQIMKTKFGAQVAALMEKANYAKAEKMAESGDSLKAAQEFEKFVETTKNPELALAARFKAASSFEKAGDLSGAARNYQKVLATPAKDARVKGLHNDARNALAKIYQQTGQLDLAARQFSAYADANTKDQAAVNGFFNAAVIWDGLGRTNEATSNYELYRRYSKRADRIDTYWLEAEMWRRRKLDKRASQFYQLYLDNGGTDGARRIEATSRIADYAASVGQFTKSMKGYSSVLNMYKVASPIVRESALRYYAEAKFNIAQPIVNDLNAIRFGTTDKTQGAAAVQIQTGIKRYLDSMKEIIRLDYGPMIVAALSSTGKMYDAVALKFERVPTPAGLSGDDAKKYRELLGVEVTKFRNEAKTSYQAALDRSFEFETYGQWTRAARLGLTVYDGKKTDVNDIVLDANAGDWMGL